MLAGLWSAFLPRSCPELINWASGYRAAVGKLAAPRLSKRAIGLGVIGSGGNEITRTTSIHNRGVPYVLLARLTVAGEPTAVLTIEPGVKLLGQTSSSYLKIFESRDGMSGGLLAEGTAAAPIVMEGRLAEPGSWGGVQVVGKPATLKLAYVHLRHTGMSGGTAYGTCPDDTSVRGDGAAVGIIGKDAGPFMTNVTISNYTGVGILRAWT